MALYQTALERILPPGVGVYAALLIRAPDALGTAEVEASYAGYARQLHSAWATHSDLDGWYLSNTGSIVFPAVTGSAVTINYWGIYLAAVGGTLFASGPVLNGGGVAYPQLLDVGDQARFLDDALRIRGGI
jgi:hypothetical protein